MNEPWLDRKALAEHLGCSVRSIELRMAEGMPAWKIMGRVKFRISEVEPWLQEQGHMVRLDGPCEDGADTENGPAAPVSRTPPARTSEVADAG